MRPIKLLIALALPVALLGGCTGTGVNSEPLYDTVTGNRTLEATVAADVSVSSVQFQVDGVQVGEDKDPNGGWSVNWDSTKVPDGAHIVKAIGQPGDTELLSVVLYTKNGGGAAPAPTASVAP